VLNNNVCVYNISLRGNTYWSSSGSDMNVCICPSEDLSLNNKRYPTCLKILLYIVIECLV